MNKYLFNELLLKEQSKILKRFNSTEPLTKRAILDRKFQYFPSSTLPTYYFQKSLPRLPIPKLDLTLKRYLDAQKPLLSENDYIRVEKMVNEFQSGSGQKLHSELLAIDKDLKETSYISAPWFEMYLKDRKPLPINYNPALVFVEDEAIDNLPLEKRQLIRSTNLIISALRFLKSLDTETLEPEVFHLNPKKSDTDFYRKTMKLLPTSYATYGSYIFKAFPLDMSQFNSLFRSTRIPMKDIDVLENSSRHKIRHITVMRRGHFYSCPVLDADGNILEMSELMGNLDYILKQDLKHAEYPLGVMTTEDRNVWADVRKNMIQNSLNKRSIQNIDSSLFVLIFDDDCLGEDPYAVTKHFLHSDGCNRWFDKSFTLIQNKDGRAGVNFEHAWGDGVAVMRFFNNIYTDSSNNKWTNNVIPKIPFELPNKLNFEFDDKTKNAIKMAQEKFKKFTDRLELSPFITEEYGRKICKKWQISPDSLMQVGFQISYNRIFNHTPTTYESCSTSAFKHGRTETIRPATSLTKEISEIMSKKNWEERKKELKELFVKCSEKHSLLTKDAAMGQGCDRHLFAMKYIAETNNIQLPDLYLDNTYKTFNYNIMSTSTLSSPMVRVGGFGPVVQDGYGIAYQIWDNGLGCLTSTYKDNKNGKDFASACETTFKDIATILNS